MTKPELVVRKWKSRYSGYHYDARYYDPQLCRWHVVDPADEFHSPFVYSHNDPINFLDIDGNFERPIHSEITQATLLNANKKYDKYKNAIIAGSQSIDIIGAFDDFHFDGRQNYKEVVLTWNSIYNKLSTINLEKNELMPSVLGYTLHTIQDFYAHSNYVELFVKYYVKKHKTMPEEVPIFSEGMKNDEFRENYLVPELRTGDYGIFTDLYYWISGIENPNSHRAMNKDHPDNPLHNLSTDAATRDGQNKLK